MSKPTRIYTDIDKRITVEWRPELCVHCGECLLGLPNVFDLTAKPWINIQADTPERIKKQVSLCPSKAISCPEQ